jgi:hypothetical protein
LQRIEKAAFHGSDVERIRIPSSVETIGEECFHGCESLREVTFESCSKLRCIDDYAFRLSAVKTIQIPSSVEIIGKKCFRECKSLSEVTFESESSLKEVGNSAFYLCDVERIEIPEKCEILSGLSVTGVRNVSISKGNRFFIIEDCFIKSANGKEMIRYLGFDERVVIGGGIDGISAGCFCECESLSEIMFAPDCKLQCIEKYAFLGSGVKTIRIPSSVEMIGENCFRWCLCLSEVAFGSGCKLQCIEKDAFRESGVKTIRIPSSVEIIGRKCFLMLS